MNIRELTIDSDYTVQPADSYCSGHEILMRPRKHVHTFIVEVKENGTKVVAKHFTAVFTDVDVYADQKTLAEKILRQMKASRDIRVYGTSPLIDPDEDWFTTIVFSDTAKHVFSWLAGYVPELLEAF